MTSEIKTDFQICPYCFQRPNDFFTVRNTYCINHYCELGGFMSTNDQETKLDLMRVWDQIVERKVAEKKRGKGNRR